MKFQLPDMHPSVKAAMKEDISAYRVDFGTDSTDMDFPTWLRATRPERYRVYLKGTEQGK